MSSSSSSVPVGASSAVPSKSPEVEFTGDDDEFDEFPAENWTKNESSFVDVDARQWTENWDDDVEQDKQFIQQLRKEIKANTKDMKD